MKRQSGDLKSDVWNSKRQQMAVDSDVPTEQQVRINIRFACWEQDDNRANWGALVAGWLGKRGAETGDQRDERLRTAERVLCDLQGLTPDQASAVAGALNRDVQELAFESWPRSKPGFVLQQNLKRLFADPGEKTKTQLAEELGVSPATLSRWVGGSQVPDTTARRMIANLFGLRDPEELENSPIFLSYLPVTHGERVAWLNSQLRSMSWRELHELFPALVRIFSPRGGARMRATSKVHELKRLKSSSSKR